VNEGAIKDATVALADIKFPTDLINYPHQRWGFAAAL
jgi:hypothetical protein